MKFSERTLRLDGEAAKDFFHFVYPNVLMFAHFISLLTVHPCDRVEPAKAGCAQTCEKKGLEPVCKCQSPEYKLAEDNKNCVFGKRKLIIC